MQEDRNDDTLPCQRAQRAVVEQPRDGEVVDDLRSEGPARILPSGLRHAATSVFSASAMINSRIPGPVLPTRPSRSFCLRRRDGRECREEGDDDRLLEPRARGRVRGLEEVDCEAEGDGGCVSAEEAWLPEGGEAGPFTLDGGDKGCDGGKGQQKEWQEVVARAGEGWGGHGVGFWACEMLDYLSGEFVLLMSWLAVARLVLYTVWKIWSRVSQAMAHGTACTADKVRRKYGAESCF